MTSRGKRTIRRKANKSIKDPFGLSMTEFGLSEKEDKIINRGVSYRIAKKRAGVRGR